MTAGRVGSGLLLMLLGVTGLFGRERPHGLGELFGFFGFSLLLIVLGFLLAFKGSKPVR